MLISLRNKILQAFFAVGFLFSFNSIVLADPIDDILVLFSPSTVTTGGLMAGQSSTAPAIIVTFNGTNNVDADTLTISLLDGGVVIPNALSLTSIDTDAGDSGAYRPAINFYRAGGSSLILRTVTSAGVVGDSSPFTVLEGTATKLIVLSEEQTLLEGRNPATSAKSGTPTQKAVGSEFPVTVYLTDDQYNRVSGTDTVTITGGSFSTFNPPSQNLVNGQATFLVTISAPNVTEDYIISSPDFIAGTLSITAGGPPTNKVGVWPSPFNPHQGPATFEYVVDEQKDVKLKVIDQFGQQVWETSDTGQPFTLNQVEWHGKNDNGKYVSAGAYYVLLEIGGSVKSKKKFGVKK